MTKLIAALMIGAGVAVTGFASANTIPVVHHHRHHHHHKVMHHKTAMKVKHHRHHHAKAKGKA